jgi:hypothetical protein
MRAYFYKKGKISPHSPCVALVHKSPYVDTPLLLWGALAKVPHHFPFPPFFVKPDFAIFTNINTMGVIVIGHGLSTAAHTWNMLIPGQRLYSGGSDGPHGDDLDNGSDSNGVGHTTINRVRGRWHQTRR